MRRHVYEPVSVQRVKGVARYFLRYASLFAALVYYFFLQVWQFENKPIAAAVDAFASFVLAAGVPLVVALVALIVGSGRGLHGKLVAVAKYVH